MPPSSLAPPRSGSTYAHPAHDHVSDFSRCQLNEDGWINLRIRVVVPISSLCDDTYSCDEPRESALRAEIEQALRL